MNLTKSECESCKGSGEEILQGEQIECRSCKGFGYTYTAEHVTDGTDFNDDNW